MSATAYNFGEVHLHAHLRTNRRHTARQVLCKQVHTSTYISSHPARARAISRMSAPKRAGEDEAAGAVEGGAGGAPPPPAHCHAPPAEDDDAYEQRLKLTDVIGFVALNGYAREANACAGLCRETWRCIPPGLSAADADRVRRDHPLWQAIIDLKHGKWKETRLGRAARTGKLARVRELGDWRADIEAAEKNGRTPLWCASFKGHPDVVRELLARGANIEAASNCSATSLFVASQNGRLNVVRELLAHGANAEAAANSGATSLFIASQSGHLDVVRELLARGANIEAAASLGATSLIIASQNGQLDVVRELLARGAEVNAATTIHGLTSLIQASWRGHVEVVRALLAAGADKHHVQNNGLTATLRAGNEASAQTGSRAAILALLAAAP